MPVDLSMVGLEGIAAGQKTLDQIEGRKVSAVLRQEKEMELQQGQREIDLQDQAARSLNEISQGSSPNSTKLFGDIDSESASAPLFVMADTFMRGGLPVQAEKYLNSAMDIKKQESDIAKDRVTTQNNKLEGIVKAANAAGQFLGGAKNQSEFDYGINELEKGGFFEPEVIEKLRGMGWTPELSAFLGEQALTVYQKATLDMQASNAKAAQQAKREGFDIARVGLRYQAERLEIQRSAEARQNKTGLSATAPTNNELAGAEAAIKNYVFKGAVPKSQEAAYKQGAQAIAARAKEMVQQDKSLNWNTAINRAVIESQVNGDWEVKTEDNWFSPDETTVTYGAGKTPDTAIPLPMDKAGKPVPAQLKKGKYYVTNKGKAMWDGTAFVVPE
jgi:hypothetical protein